MDAPTPDFSAEFGANAPFVADLFARWTQDPRGVTEDWRDYFARRDPARGDAAARAPEPAAAAQNGGAAPPADIRSEPLRGLAGRIVKNMEESLGVPTATSVRTISVRILEENRNVLNRHLAVL